MFRAVSSPFSSGDSLILNNSQTPKRKKIRGFCMADKSHWLAYSGKMKNAPLCTYPPPHSFSSTLALIAVHAAALGRL